MRGQTSEKGVSFRIENLPPVGRFYNCRPNLSENDLALYHIQNFSAKFIIVGDSGVGKTCLLNRLAYNKYSSEYKTTIGASFSAVEATVNNIPMKLALWDMAGQEQYNSVNKHYFRGANIVFLCFDLTSEESFQHLSRWQKVVDDNTTGVFATFLVGCKCDLPANVLDNEIQQYCRDNRCEYFATSAKESKFTTDLAKRSALIAAVSIQELRERTAHVAATENRTAPVNAFDYNQNQTEVNLELHKGAKKKCC